MDFVDKIVGYAFADTSPYNGILQDNLLGIGNMINLGRDRTAIAHSKVAQYSAILDKNVCQLCKYLDGMYFEVGSKDYYKYMPRVHNNCRCIYVYVGKDEINQPKPNFKEPPDDLKKLGHLTTGKQSVAGAIAANYTTIAQVAKTPTGMPSKYANIDYETGNQNVDNIIIDIVNNLEQSIYTVETVVLFVNTVQEVYEVAGEAAAVATALQGADEIFRNVLKIQSAKFGVDLVDIDKISPLKLLQMVTTAKFLTNLFSRNTGNNFKRFISVKPSNKPSNKNGTIGVRAKAPDTDKVKDNPRVNDIVDGFIEEMDVTLGLNDKWSKENNEPGLKDAMKDMMLNKSVSEETKRIADLLGFNHNDWYMFNKDNKLNIYDIGGV